MLLELCLQTAQLLLVRRDHRVDFFLELLLLRTEQRQQCIAIQGIQIRQRDAIHGRSLPSIKR